MKAGSKKDVLPNVNCGSECFIEGTLIKTEMGDKPIEEIKTGDKVWAYDEVTGKKELKKVVQLFRNTTRQLTTVNIDGAEPIICTPEHPFYILNAEGTPIVEFERKDSSDNQRQWVTAGNLKTGHIVLLSNGKNGIITSVFLQELETLETTYNFEVADYHTYLYR